MEPARGKKLARAQCLLSLHRPLQRVDAEATLLLLERVATFVITERPGVVPTILQRLAEGKAQVVTIDGRNSLARLLGAHSH